MSNQSFEQAMNQIGIAAESQRQQELLAQRRQQTYDRIRRTCITLFSATVIGAGFYYRQDLQNLFSEKFGIGVGPKIDSATSKSLNELQTQAAKRDKALDEINK